MFVFSKQKTDYILDSLSLKLQIEKCRKSDPNESFYGDVVNVMKFGTKVCLNKLHLLFNYLHQTVT